jgi:hypothetical protein
MNGMLQLNHYGRVNSTFLSGNKELISKNPFYILELAMHQDII